MAKINANVIDTSSILGTYQGECMDSTITNNNGLDITDEVIATVLESDDYKQGITYGWFMGFLGHPEDPNCMDFKDACIVMREMSLADDGKVYGKWDLLNTPVGQVVDVLQKAGVKFGISIRGAGDIINNSVDPESFVFRGFDLVSFPAFPESIPEFTAIAASSNIEDQQKYKKICAAVETHLKDISSASTLETIKSQFAKQSDTYAKIEARQKELNQASVTASTSFEQEKIQAMTNLYLDQLDRTSSLAHELEGVKIDCASKISAATRKENAIQRITAAQQADLTSVVDSLERKNRVLATKYAATEKQYVAASKKIAELKNSNLIYKQKVDAATEALDAKDRIIAAMQAEKRKTVAANTATAKRTSNLDAEITRLKAKLTASEQLLQEFQHAYASLYAGGIGVSLNTSAITSSTSVKDLKRMITAATNTSNVISQVDLIDNISDSFDEDIIDNEDDDSNLITI